MGNRKSVESSSSKIIFQTMVMSDMHLEIENRVIPEFPAAAPNLILAGDIGRPDIPSLQKFLPDQAKKRYNLHSKAYCNCFQKEKNSLW